MKKKVSILLLTTMITVGAFTGCGAANTGDTQGAGAPQTTETPSQTTAASSDTMFSEMETVDLEGNAVDSSVFKENKLTVVNVWNEGCTPCVQEIPELDKINKDYAEKGVSVKGIIYELGAGISDASRAEVEDILSMAGASYQQLTVSEKMAESSLLAKMQAFPTTYFVDSEGKVVDTVEGSRDYDGWKKLIDEVLAKMN